MKHIQVHTQTSLVSTKLYPTLEVEPKYLVNPIPVIPYSARYCHCYKLIGDVFLPSLFQTRGGPCQHGLIVAMCGCMI